MAVIIKGVEAGSLAARKGIRPGDTLEAINGEAIRDVLDYRFYMTDSRLELSLRRDGAAFSVPVRKGEYDDLGLEFETYLMDRQHTCRNKCIFCFVDQLPRGLRDSLYVKDDDSRMSFLFGSYVTLTNLTEEDIRRIIKMRLSPINISVHTTDPDLRVEMLKNPKAAESLRYIPMLTQAGIRVNTQLVLCPGVNDGPALEKSLWDLAEYWPGLGSIALVPVGLTGHREGLYPLRPYTKEEARQVLDAAALFQAEMIQKHGSRIAYPADEFFLLAEKPIPPVEYYEDFEQLEDGVGLWALLRQEFTSALELEEPRPLSRRVSIATGTAAAPLLSSLAALAEERYPGLRVTVHGVPNRLFGGAVNVAGLLCGGDLVQGLGGRELGEELLIPSVMLRHERDKFLDDTTVPWLEGRLGVPVRVVDNDGGQLLDAMIGSPPLSET